MHDRKFRRIMTLTLMSCSLLLSGCESMAKDFRKALRSAASSTSRSGGLREKTAGKNGVEKGKAGESPAHGGEEPRESKYSSNGKGIGSCPDGARLTGEPPPAGVSQWCAARTKDGREVRHGEYRRWHRNGNLKESANYKYGELDGVRMIHYPSGALQEKSHYLEGNLNGTSEHYYKDGSRRLLIGYRAGEKHGPYESWNKNSVPKEKGRYVNNEKSGAWYKYYDTAQVASIVNYFGGMKNGKTEEFAANGTLTTSGIYRNNLPSDRWVVFNKDGSRKQEGEYRNGQRDGRWTIYAKNGNVEQTMVYRDGTIVEQQAATARAALGRPANKRQRVQFGNRDYMGAELPLPDSEYFRQRPAPQQQSPADDRGGWKPM